MISKLKVHTSFLTAFSCTDSGFGDSGLFSCCFGAFLKVGFSITGVSGSTGFCFGSDFFHVFFAGGSGSAGFAGSGFLAPAFPQVLA